MSTPNLNYHPLFVRHFFFLSFNPRLSFNPILNSDNHLIIEAKVRQLPRFQFSARQTYTYPKFVLSLTAPQLRVCDCFVVEWTVWQS